MLTIIYTTASVACCLSR